MTPFGMRMRELRLARGVSQKEMAAAIGVSAAYLSALEHGRRGRPPWPLVQKIIGYFNVIWDEADELEELAERSQPRVKIDTAGLSPAATAFANRLGAAFGALCDADIAALDAELTERLARKRLRAASAARPAGR